MTTCDRDSIVVHLLGILSHSLRRSLTTVKRLLAVRTTKVYLPSSTVIAASGYGHPTTGYCSHSLVLKPASVKAKVMSVISWLLSLKSKCTSYMLYLPFSLSETLMDQQLHFLLSIFYWNIVGLQHCVCFPYTAK